MKGREARKWLKIAAVYLLTAAMMVQPLSVVASAEEIAIEGNEIEEAVVSANQVQDDQVKEDTSEESEETNLEDDEIIAESVAETADGYNVDENGVLVAYSGTATDITIPDGVTKIADEVFKGVKVTSVTLPKGLEAVGKDCFNVVAGAKVYLPSGWEGTCVFDKNSFISPYYEEYGMSFVVPTDVEKVGPIPAVITKVIIRRTDEDGAYQESDWYQEVTEHVPAFEESEFDEDGYVIKDGVLLAYDGPGGVLVIPSTVTEIADNVFCGMDMFTSIRIPDSVRKIGTNCFAKLRNRCWSITIGDGLRTIPDSAFAMANSCHKVEIGRSVETIGREAFWGCRMTELILPESVRELKDKCFAFCTYVTEINTEHVEVFGSDIFYANYAAANTEVLDLSNAVTIKANALKHLKAKRVKLGKNLESIEKDGIYVVDGGIVMLDSEWDGSCKMEEGALYDKGIDYSLISRNYFGLVVPSSVTDIGEGLLHAENMRYIVVDRSSGDISYLTSDWYQKRQEYGLPIVELDHFSIDSYEDLFDENGFMVRDGVLLAYKDSSDTIQIPEGVTKIATNALGGGECEKVYFPKGLKEIEPKGIKLAPAAKIYLPSGWEGGLKTYNGKSKYSFVTPSNGVNGTSVFIPSDIVSLDDLTKDHRMFSPVSQVIIQSKDGTDSYQNTDWYKSLIRYDVMSVVDEREFDKEGFAVRDGVLLAYIGPGKQYLYIPNTVTSIRDGMFRGMDIFDNIYVGNSVTQLGDGCFAEMRERLDWVSIGNGVTMIPDNCFSSDEKLSAVSFGSNITEIGQKAFALTKSLRNINWSENLVKIGRWAYWGSGAADKVEYAYVKTIQQVTTSDEPVHFEKVDLSSAEDVEEACFDQCDIDNLILGPKLKTIHARTFPGKVSYIQWPKDGVLENIMDGAFEDTPSSVLNDQPLPDTVKHLGEAVFDSSVPCNHFRLPLSLENAGRTCVALAKDACVELPSQWKGTCSFDKNALANASATDNDMTLLISSQIEDLEDYFLNTDIFSHYVIQVLPNESELYKESAWYKKLMDAGIVPEVEVRSGATFEEKHESYNNQFRFIYTIEEQQEKEHTIVFTIPEGLNLIHRSVSNTVSAKVTETKNTIRVNVPAQKKGTIQFLAEQDHLLTKPQKFVVDSSFAEGQSLSASADGIYGDFKCRAVGNEVYVDITGSAGKAAVVYLNEEKNPIYLNSVGEKYLKLPLTDEKTVVQLGVVGLFSDKKMTVEKTDKLGANVLEVIVYNQPYDHETTKGYDITTSGAHVVCYPSRLFTFEISASGLDQLIGTGKKLDLVNGENRLPIRKIGQYFYAQGYLESPEKELRIEYDDTCLFRTAVNWITEPSGHIYEAVEGNPVEGAVVTVYRSSHPNGMDSWEWYASSDGQKNNLLTDANGSFAWELPTGYCQVEVKKEGYATVKSRWMPGFPSKLDVNINLMNRKAPEIKQIILERDHLNLYFDIYMKKSDLTRLEGYQLTNGEKEIGLKEAICLDEAEDYAKGVSLIFDAEIDNEELEAAFTCKVSSKTSYAGIKMDDTTVDGLMLSKEVTKLQVDNGAVVNEGDIFELKATLLPKEAAVGKTVKASSTDGRIVKVVSVSDVDENGNVTIVLEGDRIGQAMLELEVEDSVITKSIPVVVPISKKVRNMVIEKYDIQNQLVEAEDPSDPNPSEGPRPSSEPGASAEPGSSVEPSPSAEPRPGADLVPSEKPATPTPSAPVVEVPENGQTYTVKSMKYKVTSAKTDGTGTVAITGASKKTVTSITIPKTVKIDGYTYKVTQIADKAFKGYKKLKKVTIGENVTKIGKNAFESCSKLKNISIKTTKLTSVGKKALKGVNAKCVIKVPKKKLAKYQKLFKGKGQGKNVKVKK